MFPINFSDIGPDKDINTMYINVADKQFPCLKIGEYSFFKRDNRILTNAVSCISMHYVPIHNILVGKHNSIALGANFCVSGNHNYDAINTGLAADFMWRFAGTYDNKAYIFSDKGQIIIQNDVWIGHEVSIMGGVTIHDGAVVAAKSHVVRDVPPYAIVGGNPARIIKYRFSKDVIDKLLAIKWWNWSQKKKTYVAHWFHKSDNVEDFCNEFYPKVKENIQKYTIKDSQVKIYLYFVDFVGCFSLWRNVIRKFSLTHKKDLGESLLLVLPKNCDPVNKLLIEKYIEENRLNEDDSIICIESVDDERELFKIAHFFIANREYETIVSSEYCYDYNVKLLSAVDNGYFYDESY